jgi:hypothetical protein
VGKEQMPGRDNRHDDHEKGGSRKRKFDRGSAAFRLFFINAPFHVRNPV